LLSYRILVTTPWIVCELVFSQEKQQFQLAPFGSAPVSSSTTKAQHYVDSKANSVFSAAPVDSALLGSHLIEITPSLSAAALVYLEKRGKCCLLMRLIGNSPPSQIQEIQKIELSAVPLKTIKLKVQGSNGAIFSGVLSFRNDSVAGFGYIYEKSSDPIIQQVSLYISNA